MTTKAFTFPPTAYFLMVFCVTLVLWATPESLLAQAKSSPVKNPNGQFFTLVEVGQLLYNPRQDINAYKSSTQIDLIQGVEIWPQASLGLGLGLSVFEVGYLFPIYADLSGDLLPNHKFSPHYFARIGYNFEGFPEGEGLIGENWHTNYEAKGGLHYGFGAGFRVKTKAQFDWLFNVGVRTFQITEKDQLWGGSWSTTHLVLQRLSLSAGIRF